VEAVEPVDQIKLLTLGPRSEVLVTDMINDLFGIELTYMATLMYPRKETVTPKLWANHRFTRT
jgi:hypothetical protein